MNTPQTPSMYRSVLFLLFSTVAFAAETPGTKNSDVPGSNGTAAAIADPKNSKEEELLAEILSRLDRLEAKVVSLEAEQRTQLAGLRSGVQTAFTQVGEQIGEMNADIARLKKITKTLASDVSGKPVQP